MDATEYDAIVEQAKKNVTAEVTRRVEAYLEYIAQELVEAEVERLIRQRALS